MPHCPVETCEVSFQKESSIKAHVQGSGGIHKGYSYNDAEEALQNGESLPAAGSDSSGGSSGSSSEGDSSSSGDGLGMPDDGGGGGGGGGEVDCPGCGEPMGTPSELEEAGLVKCSECGKGPMRYSR